MDEESIKAEILSSEEDELMIVSKEARNTLQMQNYEQCRHFLANEQNYKGASNGNNLQPLEIGPVKLESLKTEGDEFIESNAEINPHQIYHEVQWFPTSQDGNYQQAPVNISSMKYEICESQNIEFAQSNGEKYGDQQFLLKNGLNEDTQWLLCSNSGEETKMFQPCWEMEETPAERGRRMQRERTRRYRERKKAFLKLHNLESESSNNNWEVGETPGERARRMQRERTKRYREKKKLIELEIRESEQIPDQNIQTHLPFKVGINEETPREKRQRIQRETYQRLRETQLILYSKISGRAETSEMKIIQPYSDNNWIVGETPGERGRRMQRERSQRHRKKKRLLQLQNRESEEQSGQKILAPFPFKISVNEETPKERRQRLQREYYRRKRDKQLLLKPDEAGVRNLRSLSPSNGENEETADERRRRLQRERMQRYRDRIRALSIE